MCVCCHMHTMVVMTRSLPRVVCPTLSTRTLPKCPEVAPSMGHCSDSVVCALEQYRGVECTGRALYLLYHLAPHSPHPGDAIVPVVHAMGRHAIPNEGVRQWGGLLVERLAVLEVRD